MTLALSGYSEPSVKFVTEWKGAEPIWVNMSPDRVSVLTALDLVVTIDAVVKSRYSVLLTK